MSVCARVCGGGIFGVLHFRFSAVFIINTSSRFLRFFIKTEYVIVIPVKHYTNEDEKAIL